MIYEKLFLNKTNNVYIDEERTARLKQFQIDGLRFIYTQYNKKEPGIIINDPLRSGRSTQIILFLNILKPTLEQPALVLCDNVENWQRLFHHWTEDCSDVIFNSQKPFVKKKIFVNDWDCLKSMSRRDWSIVVVFDEDYTAKFVKQLYCLKAEFKIAVVTTDLKANISTFFTIYDWICPKHKIKIEDFLPKDKTVKEFVDKAIFVDYLFENKVLCRNNIETTIQTQKHEKNKTTTATPKVSRKNKDPTGTKVKRSKKIEENAVDHNINKDPRTSISIGHHDEIVKHIPTATTLEKDASDPETNSTNKTKIRKRKLLIESDSDDDNDKIINSEIGEAKIVSGNNLESNNKYISVFNTNDAMISARKKEKEDLVKIIHEGPIEIQSTEAIQEKQVDLEIASKDEINLINSTSEDLFSNLDEEINEINNMNKVRNDKTDYESLVTKNNIYDKDNEDSQDEINKTCERDKSSDEINNTQLDKRIKQHQDNAIKKFKGSFLDSIF